MKSVTNEYKDQLTAIGREYSAIISYTIDDTEYTFGNEELNEVSPHYETDILKSCMKQLDLDSNVDIPIGTEINCQFGLKVGNSYEYIDYGNYIVYSSEKQEDLLSYRIVCYDKMLYAMKDYEDLELTYPISIKDYISAIATKIGLEFEDEDFTNADKEIPEEKYLDEDGNTLGYTYRDVLDELSQVVGGIICVENNKLKIKYPNDVITETGTFENTSGTITTDSPKILGLELEGKTEQNGTPTPSSPIPINVATGEQDVYVVGKNLLEAGTINFTKNYTISGLNIQPGTYSFSAKITSNDTDASTCRVSFYSGDNATNISLARNNRASASATFTNTIDRIVLYASDTNAHSTNDNATYEDIQLEKGTATTYEPYIGNKYEINLGKNLFDKDTATFKDGYYLNASGVETSNSGYTYMTSYIKVEPNTNYSIQGTLWNVSGGGRIYFFDNSKTWLSRSSGAYSQSNIPITFTTPNNCYYISFQANTSAIDKNTIQIEKRTPTPYSSYFTPIELCKIGDYKDSIKKSEGKNLLDSLIQGNISTSTGEFETNPNTEFRVSENYIKVDSNKVGVSYITSGTKQIVLYEYKNDYTYITYQAVSSDSNLFTLNSETKYIKIRLRGSGTTTTDIKNAIVSNDSLIPYEPYLAKGKWYIEKNIGKVVYNGTENEWIQSTTSGNVYFYINLPNSVDATSVSLNLYSNYFLPYRKSNSKDDFNQYRHNLIVFNHDITNNLSDFKTWLGTHNTIVYYILQTPTYTEITNEELISQLNSIELIDGLNNISITSANLSSPLKISYISEYETITEDYLKDVNVNFSEKFGPVNSLVLSRSADSDLIYRKDDSSIEKNGLTEIKISDNQILNGNDRDEYIDNIFNRLKGIEYYTNDYDSTGITYLELGDFYKVEARGNRYLALMLNDELNVTQGFEELIHTDKPDTSVSDYKKADTTDRRINQATLIVDKQNQTIQALTSRTSNLESKQINDKAELLAKFGDYALDSRVDDITTQVETLQTDTYTKTEVKSILKGTFYDSDNNQIVSEVVKTTSGTFDENGMHYEKTNAKTKSTINEVGVRVDNAINDSELLFAGYDDNINQTIVRTDNLTVRNFLVVGSQSRFQDYEENNEQGTGVFDL